jgi:hypothetical protein
MAKNKEIRNRVFLDTNIIISGTFFRGLPKIPTRNSDNRSYKGKTGNEEVERATAERL